MIKKILLALAAMIALLIIGFLAIGFFTPVVSYQTTIEINKPREAAWKYFADESKMKEWLPNFKSIETISGKPNEVGSKYKMVFSENGSDIILTETVTEFRENEVFAFDLENEVISNKVKVRFTDKGGKTEITQEENVSGGNIIWRSIFALSKSYFAGNSKATLEKLKANIEALP